MLKNLFNRQPKALSAANAVALSDQGIKLAASNLRLEAQLLQSRQALKSIVTAARSVNTPNGTTRKILKIAENAL